MSEILLARRLGPAGFEKLVVLKRPLTLARGSTTLIEALIDEARLLARISHPNVCQVHDLEEAGGEFFLALEYLEGLSLWALLANPEKPPRPVEPRMLCGLFAQACEGLDAIHGLRALDGTPIHAVHRDISPGNLFLTEAGTLKILDLGIAKTEASEDRTPFGNVKGKLPYMSPEQAQGLAIDARSDLFSLGLVLYDVARGIRPRADRVGAVAFEVLELDGLHPAIAAIVRKATAGHRDDRFTTAMAMHAALYAAAAELGGMPTHGDLATWLATTCAGQLAARRQSLRDSLGDMTRMLGTEDIEILTLRSAIGREPIGTQEQPKPAELLSRHTEKLQLPDAEQLDLRREQTTLRTRSRFRALAVPAALVLLAALAIAVVVGFSASGDRTEPSEDRTAVSAVQPPAVQPPAVQPSAVQPPVVQPPAVPARSKPPAKPHRVAVPHEAPGELTVDSQPYAIIKLGTRSLGPTTVWRAPLPPGRYTLHAATADGREQDVPVTIESGHELKLKLDWSHR